MKPAAAALVGSAVLCAVLAALVRVEMPAAQRARPRVTARAHEAIQGEPRACDLDVMIADAYVAYRDVDQIEAKLSHNPMVGELRRLRTIVHAWRDEVLARIRSCPRGADVPDILTGHSPAWTSGAVLAAYLRLEEREKATATP